jgi:hypothetical protein
VGDAGRATEDRDRDLAYTGDGNERIGFANQLELRWHSRTKHDATCSGTFSVLGLDNRDLEVGSPRWFTPANDCAAALARKDRIAMDWSCTLPSRPTLQQDRLAACVRR